MNNNPGGVKGVRGWLFLLCLTLTVLDPLAIVSSLFAGASSLKPDFDRHPALLRLILISGVFKLALAVFSVYSGITLWRMLPGAVSTASKYLKAMFAYSVLAIFLPGLVGLPQELYREMAGPDFVSSVLTLAYSAAWLLYLKRSKRVKATYQSPKATFD
jgi:hypothetical protein